MPANVPFPTPGAPINTNNPLGHGKDDEDALARRPREEEVAIVVVVVVVEVDWYSDLIVVYDDYHYVSPPGKGVTGPPAISVK